MRQALQSDPEYASRVFNLYRARQISIADILNLGLPGPNFYPPFLRFLTAENNGSQAATTWAYILNHHYAADKLANEYISFLIQSSTPEAAAKAWAQYAGERDEDYPDRNRIFNGDFEFEPTGSPFDWKVEQTPGANIDFDTAGPHAGARSLRIEFDGTQNPTNIHVGQTVFLKPGRYHFQAYERSASISTDEGISFQIASGRVPKQLSFTTEPVLGSRDWTLVQYSFTVPQSAEGLFEIRLVRTASLRFDSLLKGTLWIDQVSISPETAPIAASATSRKTSLSRDHI